MGRQKKTKRRKLENDTAEEANDLDSNNDQIPVQVQKGQMGWAELNGCPKKFLWPCMMVQDRMVYCKADDQQFYAESFVHMTTENFEDYRRKGSDFLLKKKMKNLFSAFIDDCEWAVGMLEKKIQKEVCFEENDDLTPEHEMATDKVNTTVTEIATDEANKKEIAADETNTKEIAADETNTKEIAADETNTKEIAADETNTKEIAADETNTKEMATDETNTKEIAADETNTKEMATDETNTKEIAADETNTKEIAADETNTKEMATDETNTKEMATDETNTKEMATDETNTKEISTDETNTKEMASDETNTKEMATDETNTKEMATDETNTKEIAADETNTKEMATDETNTKEMATDETNTKEIAADETNTKEMATDETNTKEMATDETNTKEISTDETNTKEIATDETNTKEMATDETNTKEMATDETNTKEMATDETNTKEISTDETNTKEIATDETNTKEMATDETNTKEMATDETNTKEMATDETNTKEMAADETNTKEMATDETNTKEMATDETNTKELAADETNTKEIAADETNTKEMATDDLNTKEISTDDLNTKEIATDEFNLTEIAMDELNTKEIATDELNFVLTAIGIDELNTKEIATDEKNIKEIAMDILNTKEIATYETNTKEIAMDILNAKEIAIDDLNTKEIATDDLNTKEIATDELNLTEIATDELNFVLTAIAMDELNTKEIGMDEQNTKEIATDELNTIEIATDETNTKEIATDETNTKEIAMDELNTKEIATDETNTKEIAMDETNTKEIAMDVLNTKEIATDDLNTKEIATDETNTKEIATDELNLTEMAPSAKTVNPVTHGKGDKRIYDKRHCCYYCGMTYSKLSEHLQNKHAKEIDVARLLSKPKNGKARAAEWKRLRNLGDFHHKLKVISDNKGELIVDRRPREQKDIKEFLPCTHCLGFYLKDELWRHTKSCPLKSREIEASKGHVHTSSKILLESAKMPQEIDEDFLKVISGMKQDDVLECIKADNSLQMLGSNMVRKVGLSRIANVRQKLRGLGRLLIEIRKLKGTTTTFHNILTPQNFDIVVLGVQNITRNQDEGDESLTQRGCPKYDKPTLALKLGHSLKRMAEIKRGTAIRNNDDISRKEAENYIILHETEWGEKISSHATQSTKERLFNEPQLLPLTEDVVALRKYLLKEQLRLGEELKKEPSVTVWRKLALTALSRVTIFNKRRGGETGQMLLTTYTNRKTNWKEAGNTELMETLQPLEKKLMERLQIVEIVGKRDRKVPVLLTSDMRNAIDILVETRTALNLTNKYLFAAPSTTTGYLKGWDALKYTTSSANLVRPDLITTTNMRKYVATVSQVMDLNVNTDLEWLANHMGHSISVHKNYYRLQEQTLELAKVSKLLIATDEGQAHKCAGKSLDDMSLEDIPNTVLNDCEPEVENIDEGEVTNSNHGEVTDSNHGEVINESYADTEDPSEDCHNSDDLEDENETPKEKQRKRVPWTKQETDILKHIFHPCISSKKPPTKNDVMLGARKSCSVQQMVERRGWKSLKFYVWNLAQQHHKKKQKLLHTSLQN